jgi:hypothetical protein
MSGQLLVKGRGEEIGNRTDPRMELLEDPTSRHVMPQGGSSSAVVSVAAQGLMLPPTGTWASKRRKKVLEEEEYVDMLSHIIERDYFPRLAASREDTEHGVGDSVSQLSVSSFFQNFTSYDNDSFLDLQVCHMPYAICCIKPSSLYLTSVLNPSSLYTLLH